MVRDINTIYAEVNDPNTVKSNLIVKGNILLGNDDKNIISLINPRKYLVYIDNFGEVNKLELEPNKLLCFDNNCELKLV